MRKVVKDITWEFHGMVISLVEKIDVKTMQAGKY